MSHQKMRVPLFGALSVIKVIWIPFGQSPKNDDDRPTIEIPIELTHTTNLIGKSQGNHTDIHFGFSTTWWGICHV